MLFLSFFSLFHTRTITHCLDPNTPPLPPHQAQKSLSHQATLLPFESFALFFSPFLLRFVRLLQPPLMLVHLTSPLFTCYFMGCCAHAPVHICVSIYVFLLEIGRGVRQRVFALMLSLLFFLLRNMMDVSKQSETWISVPATDAAFTSCARVCMCEPMLRGTGGYLISLCCWRGGCSHALWPAL